MDIKIINAFEKQIEFSMDDLRYIIIQKGKYTKLLELSETISYKNGIQTKNSQKLKGSIYFTLKKTPEISINSFFKKLNIYLSFYQETLRICNRLAHIQFNSVLEVDIVNSKNFKVIDYKTKEEVRLHRQDEIGKCLERVVQVKNGVFSQNKKIIISKYKNSNVKNLSNHEKIKYMDMDSVNHDLDKLLKALEIK